MTPREQWLHIDNYLAELRRCLPNMALADRQEVVREISAHIRECVEEPGSSIDEILKRLGSPEMIAAQYGQDVLIRRASRGFSPVSILRATLALARRGLQGLALFLGALFGYGSGAALLLTVILKPIFPRQIGLWVGPAVFQFGYHQPRPFDPVHEVLGRWYIPVAFWLAFCFVGCTTYGIRWCLRRFRHHSAFVAGSPVAQLAALF
jgi:hypothetical protein